MKEGKKEAGKVMSARRLAYQALLRQQRGQYANLALKEVLAEAEQNGRTLEKQDRAFATALFYSALEHQITLGYYWAALSKGGRIALPIRCLLMLGGAQLLYMDVPPRAAIYETVALCKEVGKGTSASFVNGLLRELDRRRENLPMPEGNEAEKLSIAYSYPLWLVERLLQLLGQDGAQRFMAGRGPEGKGFPQGVCLRANGPRLRYDELDAALEKHGVDFSKGRLMAQARYAKGMGDVGNFDLFAEGKIAVQGESSMLVGAVAGTKSGMKVLDACAAPGGKTAYLAAAMGEGELRAWDIHPHRVALIQRNCQRLGFTWVGAEVQDATVFRPEWEGYFDLVLVDAPCSGLGVLEDKPDIKYAREPEALAELLPLQAAILSTCSRYVRRGGALIYSTCTLLPEENGGQVETFLQGHEDFERGELTPYLPSAIDPARAAGGELQLWPHIDGVAGFYMARMERKTVDGAMQVDGEKG